MGRPRKTRPVLVATDDQDAPTVLDDRPALHRDPGTWISPERIDACIERIFNGAPRLVTKVAA